MEKFPSLHLNHKNGKDENLLTKKNCGEQFLITPPHSSTLKWVLISKKWKMAFLCFTQPIHGLFDPRGNMSSSLPVRTIAGASKEVEELPYFGCI